MSRVYENREDNEVYEVEEDEVWSDNEVGAVISACYISDVEEVVLNRCMEDDMAITIAEIAKVGKGNKEYSVLKKAVLEGFPEKPEDCVPLLLPYQKNRHNITVVVEDNNKVLVYFDSESRSRLIVPKLLRNRVKQVLHANHRRDLVRVKARAQEHVYWPNMAANLKLFIDQCVQCQVNMLSHPREPMIASAPPDYPFQKVAADFFDMKGHAYLVYVDRYSGWNDTTYYPPGNATMAEVIKSLRNLFADFGVPEEFACDGGKNLTSTEMDNFLKSWGVKLRVSSTHYPQSNGRAECAVKAAKSLVMGNMTSNGSLNTDKFLRAQGR